MGTKRKAPSFDPDRIWAELKRDAFSSKKIAALVKSGILSSELWPMVKDHDSQAPLLLTAILVQSRVQETNDPEIELSRDGVGIVIQHSLAGMLDENLSMRARTLLGRFVLLLFQNLHLDGVREKIQPLVSISIWSNLLETYREELFKQTPVLRKRYVKSLKSVDPAASRWIAILLTQTVHLLHLQRTDAETIEFAETVLQLFVLLLLQLPTRRYTYFLFVDLHAFALLENATRMLQANSNALRAGLAAFRQALMLPYDNIAGRPLTDAEARAECNSHVNRMQRIAFTNHKDALPLTALAHHDAATDPTELGEHLSSLRTEEVHEFFRECYVRTDLLDLPPERPLLIKSFIQRYVSPLQMRPLFQDPVTPTEVHLDAVNFQIPRTLQYLSLQDLVLRELNHCRDRYYTTLRNELSETLTRIAPVVQGDKLTMRGESKNAKLLTKPPVILEVLPPRIGQRHPELVRAEIKLTLADSWADLQAGHLLSFVGLGENEAQSFTLRHLRTAFVEEILSADGKPIRDANQQSHGQGQRIVRLLMDTDAYEVDRRADKVDEVYSALQIVVQRPKSTRSNNDHLLLQHLQSLGTAAQSPIAESFVDLLIGLNSEGPPISNAPTDHQQEKPILKLAEPQLKAVNHCLNHSVALIEGVAGSGKTTILTEVLQALYAKHDAKTLCVVADVQSAHEMEARLQKMGVAGRHIFNSTKSGLFGQAREALRLVDVQRRDELNKVTKLASKLGIHGDHGASCEAAGYFLSALQGPHATETARQQVQEAGGLPDTQLLEELRPLECLQFDTARESYLLSTLARIMILPACDLVASISVVQNAGCKFTSLLLDDANALEECQTLVALSLTDPATLHQVVLFGNDGHLRPATQSLFSRLISTGVARITLDVMHSMRPEMTAIMCPGATTSSTQPIVANAGLSRVCQMINVPTYNGQDESEPRPGVFQNLGEAEFVVALYQYMRLLNYPSESITVICLEKGQQALVQDIMKVRCKGKVFGMPKVVTVQEGYAHSCDYALISCTRTEAAGSLLDRRLCATALSRARLGSYVFCRADAVRASGCWPGKLEEMLPQDGLLQLVSGEMFGACKRKSSDLGEAVAMSGVEHLGQYVYEMTQKKLEVESKRT
ncbi:hypothetical protein BCR37DRAFT_399598 [Protomyces lactucae-debilis]|uniref:P-loop containing nucleoside triphosphate hydrolase protein n=1 Tax=Protomyces lactucae-debilis TaxID=2754530 RepID=A0A1Y2F7E6_PROLT|nr:uncharacterized protein BCR37DRAFT_399598 [Protomyces lactucae-debilis]ORY79822.1 hypothetical protein BCR37DRAFT_399598 [Protomyces lactucae-debilis]